MREIIPLTMSNSAVILGMYCASFPEITRATAPNAIIAGSVPNQKNNISIVDSKGEAAAKASATNVYNQPQGSQVVTKPIKRGVSRDGFLKIGALIFCTGEAILWSKVEPIDIRPQVSSSKPIAINETPTTKADVFCTIPIGRKELKDAPSPAAMSPRIVYVNNRPMV